MAISYNTGATADSAGTQATSQAITIPAGVHSGDVVLILAQQVPLTSTPSTFTISSTGTTPQSAGSAVTGTESLPAAVTGQVFWFAASASDAGKVVTITASATGFWSVALAAYSGASNTNPIDVISGAFGGAGSITVTCPTVTTHSPNCWAVFLGGGAEENSTAITVPSGSTQRQNDNSSSQIAAAISDSNGSVGAGGTSIGGGTFSSVAGSSNVILTAFTVGLALPGGGELPTPPQIPHPAWFELLDVAASRADWQARGFTDLAVSFASTAGGIDTYNTLSTYNGGATQQMRVLKPTAPSASYPHAFLLMLPVEASQGTTFGDPLAVAQGLNAHNAYNLTCVEPGYPISPWFADNPNDITVSEETFTLKLTAWIRANLATTGNEAVYLIGFSKSGIGGQGLQFRNPAVYAATASWDAPFMMTDYDGTDPTHGSLVGGGSAAVYGNSWNFQTRYQLSAANLANWKATGQFAVNRIWIGGFGNFQSDNDAYDTTLTTAAIPHTYTYKNSETHQWAADWVGAALASIIPSYYAEAATTVLPQQAPGPVFLRLLEDAWQRADWQAQGVASPPPSAPPFAPQPLRHSRLALPAARRRAAAVPAAQDGPQQQRPASRSRPAVPRRGHVTAIVPPQLNPPYPVTETRQQRQPRGFWPVRGRRFETVPAQQAAAPNPAWVQSHRSPTRAIALFVRRARIASPVPPQLNPPYPVTEVTQRRQAWPRGLPRRSRVAWPPQTQAAAPNPAWVQSHRVPMRAIALLRRRFAQLMPWPQATGPSFTVGTLTAADTAAATLTTATAAGGASAGTLTATDQRTGGPG